MSLLKAYLILLASFLWLIGGGILLCMIDSPGGTVQTELLKSGVLFGFAPISFGLVWKGEPLPLTYIIAVLLLTLLFEVLPYLEELALKIRPNIK